MLEVENQTGRLVETRGRGAISEAEFSSYLSKFTGLLARLAGAGSWAVLVTDVRGSEPVSPEVSSMILGLMRLDDRHVIRSAHVVEAGTAFGQQFEQVIRDAKNPIRRAFSDPQAAIAYLDEALDPAEQARLRAFLWGQATFPGHKAGH